MYISITCSGDDLHEARDSKIPIYISRICYNCSAANLIMDV